MTQPAIEFQSVTRSFPTPSGEPRKILTEASVLVQPGEVVAIVGRSGSGKSTFLHLAAGIDLPDSGKVLVAGQEVSALDESARTLLRRDHVGLVFQFFHLLNHLTVAENIAVPEMLAGRGPKHYLEKVLALLDRVGLGDRAHDPVSKLSGGEQQRVALCRALVRDPKLLLADEPTGNLDDETGQIVMELLLSLARDQGNTLIYVTHSQELAARADRALQIVDGDLVTA